MLTDYVNMEQMKNANDDIKEYRSRVLSASYMVPSYLAFVLRAKSG